MWPLKLCVLMWSDLLKCSTNCSCRISQHHFPEKKKKKKRELKPITTYHVTIQITNSDMRSLSEGKKIFFIQQVILVKYLKNMLFYGKWNWKSLKLYHMTSKITHPDVRKFLKENICMFKKLCLQDTSKTCYIAPNDKMWQYHGNIKAG